VASLTLLGRPRCQAQGASTDTGDALSVSGRGLGVDVLRHPRMAVLAVCLVLAASERGLGTLPVANAFIRADTAPRVAVSLEEQILADQRVALETLSAAVGESMFLVGERFEVSGVAAGRQVTAVNIVVKREGANGSDEDSPNQTVNPFPPLASVLAGDQHDSVAVNGLGTSPLPVTLSDDDASGETGDDEPEVNGQIDCSRRGHVVMLSVPPFVVKPPLCNRLPTFELVPPYIPPQAWGARRRGATHTHG
jgi:hypothetical protein